MIVLIALQKVFTLPNLTMSTKKIQMQVIQLNKHLKNNRNRMIEGKKCSNVVLKTRKIGKWVDVSTDEIFKGKKVILFSLPGAFTPVCSEKQLPGFEENYDKLLGLGINEVYCISVNDGLCNECLG